jgi:hypothetical protein
MLSSCAWNSQSMTLPIKEAPISSDGSGPPRWLDNHHVMFRGLVAGKTAEQQFYVWDLYKGTVMRDPRFPNGYPFVHPDTGTITYGGIGYENFEDREGRPVTAGQPGIWVNQITGTAAATQPPPWIVDGHTSTSKVPLKEEDGYLDRGIDLQDTRKDFPIVYHRSGVAEPIPLGLRSQQVEPDTKYYSFANGYLLKGTHPRAEAPRLWLLHPDGRIAQLFDPDGKTWVKKSWSWVMLTKRGPIFVLMNIQDGGDQEKDSGLYLWENGTLTVLGLGVFDSGDISPDGCRIAVVRHHMKRSLRFEERYRIQAIDVCHGGGSNVIDD